MKIGVVGNGFVGHAMTLLRPGVDVIVWDMDMDKCEPRGTGFNKFVDESEIIFVAVPTPMEHTGKCHVDIVQRVVDKIQKRSPDTPVVLRSTVPPGTSDKMNVHFMPEFLNNVFGSLISNHAINGSSAHMTPTLYQKLNTCFNLRMNMAA